MRHLPILQFRDNMIWKDLGSYWARKEIIFIVKRSKDKEILLEAILLPDKLNSAEEGLKMIVEGKFRKNLVE